MQTIFPAPENCTDGIDNDCDGLIDCADPDCSAHPACIPSGPEHCFDGIDNDGDGLIDCADPDCRGMSCGSGCICAYGVRQETNCIDGIDNDGDGLTDCADPMCAVLPVCGGGNEICDDGIDNDGDGFIDCTDGACELHPRCILWSNLGGLTPGQICATWEPSPCHVGYTSEITLTCKPIDASCY